MLTDTEALSPRHSLQSQSDSWALSLFHQFWEGDREGMEVISAQSWRDSHVTYDGAPPPGWENSLLVGDSFRRCWTTFVYHRRNVNS